MTPRGRYLIEVATDCLEHGDLFYPGRPYGKTIGLVAPDGSIKRLATIRVQVAVWTRFHGEEIVIERDRWMTEKIDSAISLWKGRQAGEARS